MRPIEFRIWNKKHQRYMTLTNITWKDNTIVHIRGTMTWPGKEDYPVGAHGDNTFGDIDQFLLEEYTGIKDQNDVKIFEGDIVKDNYGCVGIPENLLQYEVTFDEAKACFNLYCDLGEGRGRERALTIDSYPVIVGNIHDKKDKDT